MDADAVIAGLQQAYAAAVDAKDADAFLALYDPTAQVFDTWAPWSYETTADRAASIRGWLGSLDPAEHVAVTFAGTRTIPGGELTCATAVVTYAAVDPTGRVIRSMQNRLSWVVTQASTPPRIVHEHTSVPIDDAVQPMLQRPAT